MSDFKAKMHRIQFWLGLCPRPHWQSLQHSPDPLAGFEGPTSMGGDRYRMGGDRGVHRDREGREKQGTKGEGRAPPKVWFTPHIRNPEKYPPNTLPVGATPHCQCSMTKFCIDLRNSA